MNEALLKPSLRSGSAPTSVYSVGVGVLAAFFGGVFAPICWAAANSVRLRRGPRDAPVHLALTGVACAAIWVLFGRPQWQTAIKAATGIDSLRIVLRVLALAIFGCEYLLHRTAQRHARTLGLIAPSGVAVGIGCVVVSVALQFGLIYLVTP